MPMLDILSNRETREKKMGGEKDSRGQNPFVEREQSRISGQGINRIRGY